MTDCKNLDLAREWAEWVHDNPDAYGGASDRSRAAADLIPSLPDEWVDAKELREIADEMANWLLPPDITVQEERQLLVALLDHFTDRVHNLLVDPAGTMTGGSRQVDVDTLREFISEWRTDCPAGDGPMILEQLEALLPAPPAPRTMAEIDWSDEEHHLAEALFGDTRKVVMLVRETDGEGDWSEWIHCRMEDGSTDLIEKEYLTPTGRKYRLEPADDVASATGGELTTQDVVDECRAVRKERAAAEFASPRPEDVPKGEFWIVESKRTGQQGAGVRNVLHPNIPWAVTFGAIRLGDNDISLIARLVPETAEQDDETGFDPDYIYTDRDGDEWEYLNGRWVFGDTHAKRVAVWCGEARPGYPSLPAEYGPYTRIEA